MSAARERLALAAAAATGIQVGAAMVATRAVVDDLGPASLACLRYAIGALCLIPPLLALRRVRFAPRDLAAVMALGIVQFGVVIALLNLGLQALPAARAALIFATFPLLTMLAAALLGRERLDARRGTGVLLTILGVGVGLGERLAEGGGAGQGEWLGALAVLGAAASGAVCSVLYRPYLARYPTLPVGAWAMLASVVFLAGFAVPEGLFTDASRLGTAGWAAVTFIGLSSGGGYMLWLWALRTISATRVTVFLSLSPATAALLGAWLLGEPLTRGTVAGLACVAAGLWLATRGTAGHVR
ncbi:DMT family transporter [Arenibaculum pallidiluteum]|uniref:DMT family transporter n=1 Tax=Arenibaculum pallidiluteum TaxID=2812559 RepID=UPI002E29D43B|nr:DMT family transporter [Arenibaculum pallidiluteum]